MSELYTLICIGCNSEYMLEAQEIKKINGKNKFRCENCIRLTNNLHNSIDKEYDRQMSRIVNKTEYVQIGKGIELLQPINKPNQVQHKQEHCFEFKRLEDMWWNVCIHCGIVERSKDDIDCNSYTQLPEKGIDRYWKVKEVILNKEYAEKNGNKFKSTFSGKRYFTCKNCKESNCNNGYYGDMICVVCKAQN